MRNPAIPYASAIAACIAAAWSLILTACLYL